MLENELKGFIIWELSGDIMPDLSTPLLDTVNKKLANPSMSCSEPITPSSIPPPTPTPSAMTSLPTQVFTQSPVPIKPTTGDSEMCGNGKVGNGLCPNYECCSKWGYCGVSVKHCMLFSGRPARPYLKRPKQ